MPDPRFRPSDETPPGPDPDNPSHQPRRRLIESGGRLPDVRISKGAAPLNSEPKQTALMMVIPKSEAKKPTGGNGRPTR